MSESKFRIESDLLGAREIPADALYPELFIKKVKESS